MGEPVDHDGRDYCCKLEVDEIAHRPHMSGEVDAGGSQSDFDEEEAEECPYRPSAVYRGHAVSTFLLGMIDFADHLSREFEEAVSGADDACDKHEILGRGGG